MQGGHYAFTDRIEALEKRAPDRLKLLMADLLKHVSNQWIDEAIQAGLPGVRALLSEVYWNNAERSGSEAADDWVRQLRQIVG